MSPLSLPERRSHRLRVLDTPQDAEQTKETKETWIRERARLFLKERYPLSDIGVELRRRVQESMNDERLLGDLADELPTVERPRPELYRDLEFGEYKPSDIFGNQLANVQVTKGCSHGCTFCAAGADRKVETMPFPALLKIAAQMRSYEEKVAPLLDNWTAHARQKELDFLEKEHGLSDALRAEIKEYDEDGSSLHADMIVRSLFRKKNSGVHKTLLRQEFAKHPAADYVTLFQDELPARSSFFRFITNYYDSDPFDAKFSIAHDDGAFANFGDVVELLASPARPIHITTAGWSRHAKHAQAAAEKIVALYKKDPRLLFNPRVSVNEFEHTARRDPKKYLADMKSVLETLAPLGPEVLLSATDHNRSFHDMVINPLSRFVLDLHEGGSHIYAVRTHISTFSGHAVPGKGMMGRMESDHDVMACMPGIHVWPDGTVARQDFAPGSGDDTRAPKGSRPMPIGIKLYNS